MAKNVKTGLPVPIGITYHEIKSIYIDKNANFVKLFDSCDNFSAFVKFIRVGERSQLSFEWRVAKIK